MKISHDNVISQVMTSFSYIFPYYDVIDKNADISRKKYTRVFSNPIKDMGPFKKYVTQTGMGGIQKSVTMRDIG